jgi:hypothetical protein
MSISVTGSAGHLGGSKGYHDQRFAEGPYPVA